MLTFWWRGLICLLIRGGECYHFLRGLSALWDVLRSPLLQALPVGGCTLFQPFDYAVPIESDQLADRQRGNRIWATRPSLLCDPCDGHFQSLGKFFGSKYLAQVRVRFADVLIAELRPGAFGLLELFGLRKNR